MKIDKHSDAPWEVDTIETDGSYGDGGPDCRTGYKEYAVFDAKGRVLFDSLNRDYRVNEIRDEIDEDSRYAWNEPARVDLTLAAQAPAMQLILALICAGKAELWAVSDDVRPYPLIKVGADWHRITGTYTDLVNAIGWDRCRAALEGGG